MRFELYAKQALAIDWTPAAALVQQLRDEAATMAFIASASVTRAVVPIRHGGHHGAGSTKMTALPEGETAFARVALELRNPTMAASACHGAPARSSPRREE